MTIIMTAPENNHRFRQLSATYCISLLPRCGCNIVIGKYYHMQVNIESTHFRASEALQEKIRAQFNRLEKLFQRITGCDVGLRINYFFIDGNRPYTSSLNRTTAAESIHTVLYSTNTFIGTVAGTTIGDWLRRQPLSSSVSTAIVFPASNKCASSMARSTRMQPWL